MTRRTKRCVLIAAGVSCGLLQMAGCPLPGSVDILAGGIGDSARLGDEAQVQVLSPQTSLAITGGTPVEVNWTAVATTAFSVVNIIFDVDQIPDNDNEIVALTGLGLNENTALLNTSDLPAGTFFIGVVLTEASGIAAFDYAQGAIFVNEQSSLTFTSPRGNVAFDRTIDVLPLFNVSWTVADPDSTVSVRVFLDPDTTPNGNEVLLRESSSQTGDSFSFNLPTATFEPGVYRILAIASDGVGEVAIYAPGSIRIRARLAGAIDLRDLGLPQAPVSGAVFEGFNPRDNAGSLVRSLRDYDGDGFSDFLILSQFAKPQFISNVQRVGAGEAYMIYGRSNRFGGSIALNSTGTLFRGEVFTGVLEVLDPLRPTRGITSVALLSDWDGDGFREIAFGVPFTDSLAVNEPLDTNGYFRTGGVVIASSSALRPDLGFPGGNVMGLSEFGSLQHFPVPPDTPGCNHTFLGPKAPTSVSGSGPTLMHRYLLPNRAGQPNPGSVRLGCRLSTNEFNDQCGESVSAYQFNSIIMSVPNRDPAIATIAGGLSGAIPSTAGAGVVSTYFCHTEDGFFPWFSTNAPANTIPNDPVAADFLPHHGPYHYIIDDFLNGSPGYQVDPDNSMPCNMTSHGDLPNDSQPSSTGNSRTMRFFTTVPGARLSNVAGADDFNGDGLEELLIGAPFFNEGAGATFIVFGRLRNLVEGGELDVNELALPLNANVGNARIFDGLQIVGSPGARLGQAQDAVGDFNNDGLPDVAIGSPLINGRRGGVAVLFGSRELINAAGDEIPFDAIPERGLGVIFAGESDGDLAGARVAGAGDVDGDGFSDLLIAAPDRSVRLDIDRDGVLEIDRTNCGVVYLIYGSADLKGTLNLSEIGTERLPGAVFIGRNSGDFLGAGLGEQGDRSTGIAGVGDVDGDGRGDLMFGSVSASPRDRVRAGEAYLIYGDGD